SSQRSSSQCPSSQRSSSQRPSPQCPYSPLLNAHPLISPFKNSLSHWSPPGTAPPPQSHCRR
ncbi:MAG: hypothetical protein ACLFPH_09825, partial [Bacteroidales bacterium]